MTTTSLKSKLYKLIDKNENEEFLKELVSLVKDANSKKNWWDELTTKQQKELEEALEDVKKNGGIPHSVVMKNARKWITK